MSGKPPASKVSDQLGGPEPLGLRNYTILALFFASTIWFVAAFRPGGLVVTVPSNAIIALVLEFTSHRGDFFYFIFWTRHKLKGKQKGGNETAESA